MERVTRMVNPDSYKVVYLGYGVQAEESSLWPLYQQLRRSVYLEGDRPLIQFDSGLEDSTKRRMESEDDERSGHFAVVGSRGTSVQGTTRLIHRGERPLPAEVIFPDEFKKCENPPSESAVEVSRLIVSRGVRAGRTAVFAALLAAAHTRFTEYGGKEAYAVAEGNILRILGHLGVGVACPPSNPVEIDQYTGRNSLLTINPGTLVKLGSRYVPSINGDNLVIGRPYDII